MTQPIPEMYDDPFDEFANTENPAIVTKVLDAAATREQELIDAEKQSTPDTSGARRTASRGAKS